MAADPVVDQSNFITATLLRAGKSGDISFIDFERDYEEEWLVVLDNLSEDAKLFTAVEVCQCELLPTPFSPLDSALYSSDINALVTHYSATQSKKDEDWFKWFVRIKYTTKMPEGGIPPLYGWPDDPLGAQNQPWLERRKIEWSWETVRRARSADFQSKAYLNAAKMPFTPAPTTEVTLRVLTITDNLGAFDVSIDDDYDMVVNEDTYLGRPPGNVMSYPNTVTEMYRGQVLYYRSVRKLRFAPRKSATEYETWQPRILNNGMHQLKMLNMNGIAKTRQVLITIDGRPVSAPVLLDLDGKFLDPVNDDPDFPVIPTYIDFVDYDAALFSDKFDIV